MTNDILVRLADLHKQATIENSHFYVASVARDAIIEIARLRTELKEMRESPQRPRPLASRAARARMEGK